MKSTTTTTKHAIERRQVVAKATRRLKICLVNLGPMFTFQNLSESWERYNYLVLLSVQNFTFG